jgi:hypothetical protein
MNKIYSLASATSLFVVAAWQIALDGLEHNVAAAADGTAGFILLGAWMTMEIGDYWNKDKETNDGNADQG